MMQNTLRNIIHASLVVTIASFAAAQSDEVLVTEGVQVGVAGSRTVTLELGNSGIVSSSSARGFEPSPAEVFSPGTRLVLKPSSEFGVISNVRWFRNDLQIASNTPELIIDSAAAEHSGHYWATFDGHSTYGSTSPRQITVGIGDRHRLVNMSSRVTLSPSTPSATLGFVIAPRAAPSFQGQEVLMRVVGPSLADFGVANPLLDPELTLRAVKSGDIVSLAFTQVVFSDGSTPESHYLDRIRAVSATVGAFPIPLSDPLGSTPSDRVLLMHLPVGAYTVTANSSSGATGDVLIEVYEVDYPESEAPPPFTVIVPADSAEPTN